MKDYSHFIKSSYGFITHYEIVDKELHVYTAETEKGEPQKMPATKENIEYIESRLAMQYEMIINNRDIARREYSKEKEKQLMSVAGVICLLFTVAGFTLGTMFNALWLAPMMIGVAATALISTYLGYSVFPKKFDRELDAYKEYIENRKNIALASEKDKNITAYLSLSAYKLYQNNQKMEKQGIIDNTFNIDFMDKVQLKDLKKLLSRYKISTQLYTEQKFVNPEPKKQKTRKRKNKVNR